MAATAFHRGKAKHAPRPNPRIGLRDEPRDAIETVHSDTTKEREKKREK